MKSQNNAGTGGRCCPWYNLLDDDVAAEVGPKAWGELVEQLRRHHPGAGRALSDTIKAFEG